MRGPFAAGTSAVMVLPDDTALPFTITWVEENVGFEDLTAVPDAGVSVRVRHALAPTAYGTQITYRCAVDGPDDVAAEIGVAVSADFADVISALAARAERASEALPPSESPGLLLWRATLKWQRAITAQLKPLGLTHVQFVLLATTWWLTTEAGETPSQRRVAEHAATDPMMTSQVLRVLESKGLIERRRDPSDSRARRIGVTAAGAELAARAVQVVEATDSAFFGVTKNQRQTLKVLRALAG
jgi:DNA-binding MarR family transcriptional regulator